MATDSPTQLTPKQQRVLKFNAEMHDKWCIEIHIITSAIGRLYDDTQLFRSMMDIFKRPGNAHINVYVDWIQRTYSIHACMSARRLCTGKKDEHSIICLLTRISKNLKVIPRSNFHDGKAPSSFFDDYNDYASADKVKALINDIKATYASIQPIIDMRMAHHDTKELALYPKFQDVFIIVDKIIEIYNQITTYLYGGYPTLPAWTLSGEQLFAEIHDYINDSIK